VLLFFDFGFPFFWELQLFKDFFQPTLHGLSIRQAIVDDPELSLDPKLTSIVDGKVSGELTPRLLKVAGVAKISVY